MRKLLSLAAVVVLAGCASFSTNIFRTEQTAVNLVFTAYTGYTNALPSLNLTPDQSNTVKTARLQFAASVAVLEAWREAYETNSAVQPQVEAALNATTANASNVVWLITYIRGGGK